LLDDWLESIKHQRDLETAKQWAKQGGRGRGPVTSDAQEGGVSVRELMEIEDPMSLVQKGGVFNFPNPNIAQSMILTEPSFEEMQRIHPV